MGAQAFFLGYQAEVEMAQAETGEWNASLTASQIFVTNVMFSSVFMVECLLRILAYGRMYFFGDGWRWNIFDVVLVLSTVPEFLGGVGFRSARILRVFRTVRVLRAIRIVRAFRELREMVCSLFSTVSSLGWAFVMMVLFIYLFAIFLMQSCSMHLEQLNEKIQAGDSDPEKLEDKKQLVEIYGSLQLTMFYLFASVSGGEDWLLVMAPLKQASWVLQYFFVLYIFLMVFGMLNILTGVFCEKAAQASALDRDLLVQRHRDSLELFLRSARDIFEDIDKENSGTISWEDFREHIKDPNVMMYLMSTGLDVIDARRVFQLMDDLKGHSDKLISLQDFVYGMTRLVGEAKGSDLAMLLSENRHQTQILQDYICEQYSPHSPRK